MTKALLALLAALAMAAVSTTAAVRTTEEDYKACKRMAVANSGASAPNVNVNPKKVIELIRNQCGMTYAECMRYAGGNEAAEKRCVNLPMI